MIVAKSAISAGLTLFGWSVVCMGAPRAFLPEGTVFPWFLGAMGSIHGTKAFLYELALTKPKMQLGVLQSLLRLGGAVILAWWMVLTIMRPAEGEVLGLAGWPTWLRFLFLAIACLTVVNEVAMFRGKRTDP